MLLNPLMAWIGALAVSVPIIIHLLNKRKFEKVVWGAMRFLKVSVEQNQRRLQIEDLLLLILRCLLLFLLGLALARPTILFPAVKKAVDTLTDRRAGAREIYLITDTQALGWKQYNDIRNSLEEV